MPLYLTMDDRSEAKTNRKELQKQYVEAKIQ